MKIINYHGQVFQNKMRIISGLYKGRKLIPPKAKLEPTKDVVKEALFNILGQSFENQSFLDIFAGTGNIGIEALSRGANPVVWVENNNICVQSIKKNLTSLNRVEQKVIQQNAFLFLKYYSNFQFNYIFADPPYYTELQNQFLLSLSQSSILKQDTVIILEHPSKLKLDIPSSHFQITDQRVYGITTLSFFASV